MTHESWWKLYFETTNLRLINDQSTNTKIFRMRKKLPYFVCLEKKVRKVRKITLKCFFSLFSLFWIICILYFTALSWYKIFIEIQKHFNTVRRILSYSTSFRTVEQMLRLLGDREAFFRFGGFMTERNGYFMEEQQGYVPWPLMLKSFLEVVNSPILPVRHQQKVRQYPWKSANGHNQFSN